MEKILVYGSLAFDVIFSIPHDFRQSIPVSAGKVRSFNATYVADEKKEFPGGTAGNIAFWLGTEGVQSTLFSAWGTDLSEKKYREKLETLGVELRGVQADFTAHAYMISDPLHQQLIIWQPNAYARIESIELHEHFEKEELMQFSFAIFSAGTPASLLKHIKEFRNHNTEATTIFDPGQVTPHFQKDDFQACCEYADMLIGNDIEFQHFETFGIPDHLITIKTRGEQGAHLIVPEKPTVATLHCNVGTEQTFPAKENIKVMETTGAGDAFRAGVLAHLAQGKNLESSIKNGIKLGAKCVTLPSAQY